MVFKNRFLGVILGVAFLILLVFASVYLGILARNALKIYDYIGISQEQRYSIAVSGEGEVVAVPDVAVIKLGLVSEKSTVAAAQKENSSKMNSVINKIKSDFKIRDKDIKTTDYRIYPKYNWDDGRQILRGYAVSQTINLKIRDLDSIGAILQLAGELNLNQIGNLNFEVDDLDKFKQEARLKAIKNAQEKAQELSKALGIKLSRIIDFSESNPASPIYRDYFESKAINSAAAPESPEIEPGSSKIKASITLKYEIL